MKRVSMIMAVLAIAINSFSAHASDKLIKRSTDALCLAPDAAGLCIALAEHDKEGLKQLALSTATCLAVNYGLELCVSKQRPDGTGHHSFPSTHTAVAANGTTFLMKRYGWKWGVPAAAISGYVAWGRVHANRHDWWDVLGGAAVGAGCAWIFSRPFAGGHDIAVGPITMGDRAYGLSATVRF